MKRETKAEFHARMRAILGLPAQVNFGLRVASWLGFSCGQEVYDVADPRHVGKVRAIANGRVLVTWEETGWQGEIDLADCRLNLEGRDR